MRRPARLLTASLAALLLAGGWSHPGGDPGHQKYSPLDQISPANVARLDRAWTFSTGDLAQRPALVKGWKFQVTPILADQRLVFCTPRNEVIALDPATGAALWRYDPRVPDDAYQANERVCRGVTTWTDPQAGAGAACKTRVLTATLDRRLIALDLATGKPCAGFGDNGVVWVSADKPLLNEAELKFTSPPAIARETILIGSQITDGARSETPSGMVRAFDVRSGALKWTFDPIPRDPADPRRTDWQSDSADKIGAANAWTPIAADDGRGLFYVATGSASPDYFGGDRKGANRDANSVVALDAATGRRVWAFQTVRHDIWDYDVSAPPTLATITVGGVKRDAVIQVTKMGYVFTLDRDTGAPIFPIVERPAPRGDIPEEHYEPTQPAPTLPKPLVPEEIKAFGLTPWDRGVCEREIAALRYEGLFTPPSLQGTLIHPFSGGGANWGGAAFDPNRQILIVNTSDAAEFAKLIPRADDPNTDYKNERFAQDGAPYTLDRGLVRSPIGAPCTDPPWGRLHAIDMTTGAELWRTPLGAFEDLAPFGDLLMPKGTPNLGGPMITASGLIFIGATMDDYLRAFDLRTGRELWKGRLPGGGQATPMSYEWQGRQYVLIAAGGHGLMGTTPGDQLVAFALPENNAGPRLLKWWDEPTPRLAAILGAVLTMLIAGFALLRRRRA